MARGIRCVLIGILTGSTAFSAWGQEKPGKEFAHREIRVPKGFVIQAVFSPDGKVVAAGGGAVVAVWNVADGKEMIRMEVPRKQVHHYLAFSHDGKTLIWSGSDDPLIRIFDVQNGKQIRQFRLRNGPNQFLAFSPDGKRMAFRAAPVHQGLDVIDLATGKIVLEIAEAEECRGCDFSADGKLIATMSTLRVLRIRDAATGKLVKELAAADRGFAIAYALARFSPDGKYLATGGHTDASLKVWNVQTGKLEYTFKSTASFRTVSFSQDNKCLVYAHEFYGKAALHSLTTDPPSDIYTFNPPRSQQIFAAFSPDFKRVAVVGPSAVDGESSIDGQMSIYLYDVPPKALNP